jgi:hypothetical protein
LSTLKPIPDPIETRLATPEEVKAYNGYCPPGMRIVHGAFQGGKPIGMCGIIRDPAYYGSLLEEDGRWFAILDIDPVPKEFGLQVMISIRHFLKSFTEPLWAYCDTSFPTAEKLLTAVGFRPTEEICANWRKPSQKVRVWKWQG